ncbi:hypothetical protein [Gemmobacter sp. 24YEA27]|uniref:hypothetical protein n=1 Tax=Gemmobacter sp. 24YEA27 TaxID=3040672 RepID=UPI0024B34525|nr:hypothetical protein [Gemmobacter sp. 24YEA27]
MLAYAVSFEQAHQRITQRDFPVYGSAPVLILPDEAADKAFSRASVPWYNGILAAADAGSLHTWGQIFLVTEKNVVKSTTTLANCWRIGPKTWFSQAEDQFGVVIISGNPFSVFDFAAFAKRKWSARVLPDHRAPFANTPRMGYKPEARLWARYSEKAYNLQADLVTVMNDDCALMVGGREDVPVAAVMNGFDDCSLPLRRPRLSETDGLLNFVNAGRLCPGRSPVPLISELHRLGHKFCHVGNPSAPEAASLPDGTIEILRHPPLPRNA